MFEEGWRKGCQERMLSLCGLCRHGRCLATSTTRSTTGSESVSAMEDVMDLGIERPSSLVAATTTATATDYGGLRSAFRQCSRQAGRVVHPSWSRGRLSLGYRIIMLFGTRIGEPAGEPSLPNKLAVGSAVARWYAQWRRVVQNRVCLPAFLQSIYQTSAVHIRRRRAFDSTIHVDIIPTRPQLRLFFSILADSPIPSHPSANY